MATGTKDFYKILGVSEKAPADQIKKAYRKKAVQHHPDKNPNDSAAEEMFKQISEAYEVLQDGEKRAAYDRFGHAAFEQAGRGRSTGGFHDPFDIFREVFGSGAGAGSIFEDLFGGSERSPGGA